jgi:hypothetical protein
LGAEDNLEKAVIILKLCGMLGVEQGLASFCPNPGGGPSAKIDLVDRCRCDSDRSWVLAVAGEYDLGCCD